MMKKLAFCFMVTCMVVMVFGLFCGNVFAEGKAIFIAGHLEYADDKALDLAQAAGVHFNHNGVRPWSWMSADYKSELDFINYRKGIKLDMLNQRHIQSFMRTTSLEIYGSMYVPAGVHNSMTFNEMGYAVASSKHHW